ncbi:Ank3 [Scenedesmus sp. PABB004]|nr:Ank3 [Scenedesmus sp. PABB004]
MAALAPWRWPAGGLSAPREGGGWWSLHGLALLAALALGCGAGGAPFAAASRGPRAPRAGLGPPTLPHPRGASRSYSYVVPTLAAGGWLASPSLAVALLGLAVVQRARLAAAPPGCGSGRGAAADCGGAAARPRGGAGGGGGGSSVQSFRLAQGNFADLSCGIAPSSTSTASYGCGGRARRRRLPRVSIELTPLPRLSLEFQQHSGGRARRLGGGGPDDCALFGARWQPSMVRIRSGQDLQSLGEACDDWAAARGAGAGEEAPPCACEATESLGRGALAPEHAHLDEVINEAHLLQVGAMLGEASSRAALAAREAGGPVGHPGSFYGSADTDACLGPWDLLVAEASASVLYWAWRRPLRKGLHMYMTRSVFLGASPAELRAFMADDAFRVVWDAAMLVLRPVGGGAGAGGGNASVEAMAAAAAARASSSGGGGGGGGAADGPASPFADAAGAAEAGQRPEAVAALLQTEVLPHENGVLQALVQFPKPMASRAYLYARRVWPRPSDGGCYCLSKACAPPGGGAAPALPARGVSVDDYVSGCVVRAPAPGLLPRGYAGPAAEVFMVYFEDSHVRPGLANLGIKKGLWPLVQRTDKALRVYQAGAAANAHLAAGAGAGAGAAAARAPTEAGDAERPAPAAPLRRSVSMPSPSALSRQGSLQAGGAAGSAAGAALPASPAKPAPASAAGGGAAAGARATTDGQRGGKAAASAYAAADAGGWWGAPARALGGAVRGAGQLLAAASVALWRLHTRLALMVPALEWRLLRWLLRTLAAPGRLLLGAPAAAEPRALRGVSSHPIGDWAHPGALPRLQASSAGPSLLRVASHPLAAEELQRALEEAPACASGARAPAPSRLWSSGGGSARDAPAPPGVRAHHCGSCPGALRGGGDDAAPDAGTPASSRCGSLGCASAASSLRHCCGSASCRTCAASLDALRATHSADPPRGGAASGSSAGGCSCSCSCSAAWEAASLTGSDAAAALGASASACGSACCVGGRGAGVCLRSSCGGGCGGSLRVSAGGRRQRRLVVRLVQAAGARVAHKLLSALEQPSAPVSPPRPSLRLLAMVALTYSLRVARRGPAGPQAAGEARTSLLELSEPGATVEDLRKRVAANLGFPALIYAVGPSLDTSDHLSLNPYERVCGDKFYVLDGQLARHRGRVRSIHYDGSLRKLATFAEVTAAPVAVELEAVEVPAAATGAPFEVHAKTLIGKVIPLSVSADTTVLQVQQMIQQREGIPVGQSRYIFAGKQLADEQTLGDLGLRPPAVASAHAAAAAGLPWLAAARTGAERDAPPPASGAVPVIHLVSRLRGGMFHVTSGRADNHVPLPLAETQVTVVLPSGAEVALTVPPEITGGALLARALAPAAEQPPGARAGDADTAAAGSPGQQQQDDLARLLARVRELRMRAGGGFRAWGKREWAAVLAAEDALRLCPETQAAYAAAEQQDSATDWLEVTEGLQRRVLAEAGVDGGAMHVALAELRAAPHRHAALKPLCLYHRHQRAWDGPPVGSAVPPELRLAPPGAPGARVRLLDAFTSPRHELLPMAELAEEFGGLVSSVVVYIAEAHAEDEWPIKSSRFNGGRGPVCIPQHATTAARCVAAAAFAAAFGLRLPLLVDPVPGEERGDGSDPGAWLAAPAPAPAPAQPPAAAGAAAPAGGAPRSCLGGACAAPPGARRGYVGLGRSGPFDAALAPWPLRFYVLDRRGVLRFRADPRDCAYDILELRAFLQGAAARPAGARRARRVDNHVPLPRRAAHSIAHGQGGAAPRVPGGGAAAGAAELGRAPGAPWPGSCLQCVVVAPAGPLRPRACAAVKRDSMTRLLLDRAVPRLFAKRASKAAYSKAEFLEDAAPPRDSEPQILDGELAEADQGEQITAAEPPAAAEPAAAAEPMDSLLPCGEPASDAPAAAASEAPKKRKGLLELFHLTRARDKQAAEQGAPAPARYKAILRRLARKARAPAPAPAPAAPRPAKAAKKNPHALHAAAWRTDVAELGALLDAGGDTSKRDRAGLTALHYAAWQGSVEGVELLLGAGAKADAADPEGMLPLHFAAWFNRLDVAALLLDRGSALNPPARGGQWPTTPLIYAAKMGHADMAALLMERGADVAATYKAASSALHEAAWAGHAAVVAEMLRRGVSHDLATSKSKYRPLHLAAMSGSTAVVAELLAQGAWVDARSQMGRTPLHLSCEKGHVGAAAALVAGGADLLAKDRHGFTPLHLAVDNNHTALAKLLLDKGATPDAPDAHGALPLNFAHDPDFFKLLRAVRWYGAASVPSGNNARSRRYVSAFEAAAPVGTAAAGAGAGDALRASTSSEAAGAAIAAAAQAAQARAGGGGWLKALRSRPAAVAAAAAAPGSSALTAPEDRAAPAADGPAAAEPPAASPAGSARSGESAAAHAAAVSMAHQAVQAVVERAAVEAALEQLKASQGGAQGETAAIGGPPPAGAPAAAPGAARLSADDAALLQQIRTALSAGGDDVAASRRGSSAASPLPATAAEVDEEEVRLEQFLRQPASISCDAPAPAPAPATSDADEGAGDVQGSCAAGDQAARPADARAPPGAGDDAAAGVADDAPAADARAAAPAAGKAPRGGAGADGATPPKARPSYKSATKASAAKRKLKAGAPHQAPARA